MAIDTRPKEYRWYHHPGIAPDLGPRELFYSAQFEAEKAAYVRRERQEWESSLRDIIPTLGAVGVAIVLGADDGPVLVGRDGRPISADGLPSHFAWRVETTLTIQQALTAPPLALPGQPWCPRCAGPAAVDDPSSECLRCVVEYWRRIVFRPPPRTRRPRTWQPAPAARRALPR